MNLRIPRICWLAVFLLPIAGTSGAVIYVDGNSPGGDGSSWAEAYDSLQDALADANASPKPVEIRVARGTYRPAEHNGERTAAFELINGVTICGGYAGYGRPDPNARNVRQYETILSGDLNGDDNGFVNNGENTYHVVYSFNTDETAVLDGFTVTAGNADGYEYSSRGGGMLNCRRFSPVAAPTIINCRFTGNSAIHRGGALYNHEGGPMITGCTFCNNLCGADGGGIYNHHQGSVLTNCIFAGNFAAGKGGGVGGDNLWISALIMTNCTLVGNVACEQGGGMFDRNASLVYLSNCIFWDNEAYEGPQMALAENVEAVAEYSCFQGGLLDVFTESSSCICGTAIIDAEPCFADASAGDYHLKSRFGRWDPNERRWTTDEVTSVCIDAGYPDSDWTAELWPHGKRINMGAFGGTPQAGMSGSAVGNKADLDDSGSVDFVDFGRLTYSWRAESSLRPEDLNRDAIVDFLDILEFTEEWVWQEL